MDKPNAVGLASEIIDALEQSPVDAYIDSTDSAPSGNDRLANFACTRYVNSPDDQPLGVITYVVTVEATYTPRESAD